MGPIAGILLLVAVLAVFAVVGFTTRTRGLDVETFVVARNSQGASSLALTFLASGLGAWILFAPPVIGAQLGALAVGGYAVAAAAPVLLFGYLGTRIRRVAPTGASVTGFLRARFGPAFHHYIVGVSTAYMLLFLTAELTGVGAIVAIIAGVAPPITVLAVSVVTLAYTAYAGLPASIRTDRWQAWLILALLVAGVAAMLLGAGPSTAAADAVDVAGLNVFGFEVAVTLVIAVTAANMFHQGYWQRVWAAQDDRALRRGTWIGALGVMPVVAVAGGAGIVAAVRGLELGAPPAPFFALLAVLPVWVGAGVVVLGVALCCSSVDTLENGLASLLVVERDNASLRGARLATAALMVPAVLLALRGYDVLRLFLIADLLCAATVVPAMLGLWRRATPAGALAGAVAGLAGALLAGMVAGGGVAAGLSRVTFPLAAPTLPEFAGAIAASTLVAVAFAVFGPRQDRPRDDAAAPVEQAVAE